MHNLKTDSDFSFKKENRIKSKNAFQIVYKTGRSVVDSMSVMYVLANDEKNIKIGFAVGKKIIVESPLYSYASGGGRESVVPTEVENGTLAYADISMTFISDAGAREMRALMKGQNLSLDKFKELVLAHGNTVTRRVIFMSDPIE